VFPTGTPVPTPAATPSKTATARPANVQTPTPAAEFTLPTSPPVTKTPKASADLYRLRTWSDTEAAALVACLTGYVEGTRADWELYTYCRDWGRHEIIEAGYEFIWRYPHSAYRPDVEWQMVAASTYLSGLFV
jgi:hypothetical protein